MLLSLCNYVTNLGIKYWNNEIDLFNIESIVEKSDLALSNEVTKEEIHIET